MCPPDTASFDTSQLYSLSNSISLNGLSFLRSTFLSPPLSSSTLTKFFPQLSLQIFPSPAIWLPFLPPQMLHLLPQSSILFRCTSNSSLFLEASCITAISYPSSTGRHFLSFKIVPSGGGAFEAVGVLCQRQMKSSLRLLQKFKLASREWNTRWNLEKKRSTSITGKHKSERESSGALFSSVACNSFFCAIVVWKASTELFISRARITDLAVAPRICICPTCQYGLFWENGRMPSWRRA